MIDLFGKIQTNLIFATIITMLCSPLIIFFLEALIMPFKKKEELKKAKDKGNVVIANLVRTSNYTPSTYDDPFDRFTVLEYEYWYENKKYKYKVRSHWDMNPTKSIKLYFKSNPAKAKDEVQFGGVENKISIFGKVFLGALIIGLIVL